MGIVKKNTQLDRHPHKNLSFQNKSSSFSFNFNQTSSKNPMKLSQIFTLALTTNMSAYKIKAFDWANQNNVLGDKLQIASTNPMTGFTRDGKCTAYTHDSGSHTVAAVVTEKFLKYTKDQGNDLSTPRDWGFPGLVEGNRWCLCVSRWTQAMRAGSAPPVMLEATNESVLSHVGIEVLRQYKWSAETGPALTGSR